MKKYMIQIFIILLKIQSQNLINSEQSEHRFRECIIKEIKNKNTYEQMM